IGTTPRPRGAFLSRQQASDDPRAAMPGPRPPTAGPGAPTGPPGYALWLAIGLQAVISTGDGLVLVALASLVYHQGSHAWAVAAVFLAVTIPITALAPLAGLLLDRLP